jgi:hypothetical protein
MCAAVKDGNDVYMHVDGIEQADPTPWASACADHEDQGLKSSEALADLICLLCNGRRPGPHCL